MSLEPSELFPEVPNLYEFPSVHLNMISDSHRLDAYRRAIERTVKSGDVVVDVGTGTGLLAFLCLQAGAARVHAIDRSPVIECARELAEANNYADRITFYPSDSRDTKITEQGDVIISELIGHIAFEEGMVEALFDAKERFLKPAGVMLPQTVTLFAAPVYEQEVYDACIDAWKAPYGLDYSVMRERALRTSYITDISEYDLLAQYQPVFSVDFVKNSFPQLDANMRFKVHRTGRVNGVAFWFDSVLAEDVLLSSGPWAKTHWKQTFAPIADPIDVHMGDELQVSISMALRNKPSDKFTFHVGVEA